MKINVPGVPPSLNEFVGRENCWEYRSQKRKWTAAVQWAIKAAKDKPEKTYPFAFVTITYFFPNRNRHDADNYAGKFLLDGLTRGGLIIDDDLKHIAVTIQGDYDKEHPRTEIKVVPYGITYYADGQPYVTIGERP